MTVSTIYLRSIQEVCRFAGNEATRPDLHGVYVENHDGSCNIVATNGHVLCVRRIVDPDIQPIGNVVIPPDVVNHWRFTKKAEDQKAALVNQGGGSFAITDGTVTRIFKSIEKYPDWRRVVPTQASGEMGQFNWDYLSRLKKFGEALDIGSPALVPNGTNDPAIVRFKDPYTFAVLMPMRADTPAMEPPLWLTEVTKKAA